MKIKTKVKVKGRKFDIIDDPYVAMLQNCARAQNAFVGECDPALVMLGVGMMNELYRIGAHLSGIERELVMINDREAKKQAALTK